MATSRYSKVSRRVWGDLKFTELSAPQPNAQTLWFRLLTGPELTNIPGLFPARESGMAEALGWPLEAFRKAFREVSEKGMSKADWKHGLVWVPKAMEHNRPESPNVVIGWATLWVELPECSLKDQAFQALKAFTESLGEAYAKAFRKAFGEVSPNQEQEQEPEQEIKSSARCATGEFKLDSAPVSRPSIRKLKTADEPESHETHDLKLHYVAEFERTRKAKAEFGRQWSRAMRSFRELHEVHGLELAKSIITAALSDSFARRVTPWELVEDACKWVGERPKSGPKFTPPQPNDEKNRYVPRMGPGSEYK